MITFQQIWYENKESILGFIDLGQNKFSMSMDKQKIERYGISYIFYSES